MLPYVLGALTLALACLVVRHINGQRTPILIALLAVLIVCGAYAETQHRLMEHRYTMATQALLHRHDTYVVCQRLGSALLDVGIDAGSVRMSSDGHAPRRADLTWETCRDLHRWEASGKTATHREQVIAVHVLTHESMHLAGFYDEASAECHAMQHDARTAQLLGATPQNARALADRYWETVYPQMPDGYRTTECRPDGPLDETPHDGVWP